MLKVVVFIASLVAAIAEIPSIPRVSASIRDTTVNGVEGLNIDLGVPFKVQDYILGMKYKLGSDLKRLPDLFMRKSFPTPAKGIITFDSEFTPANNNLGVVASWDSETLGVTASISADVQDKFKKISLTKKLIAPNDLKVLLSTGFNAQLNKFCGSVRVNNEDTSVKIEADSVDIDPKLTVVHAIDKNHQISPSVNLRTGKQSYGISRQWEGGSVSGAFVPGDKVTIAWADRGAAGTWVTSAEVPLATWDKPKVTFSRDWEY